MDKLRSVSHWLGDFCLRLILLVGMSIVFSAGVYMSWEHTTAMAIRLGNPPSHAVAYTWFVETLLVASEIVVLFQATRRQKPHASVFVGVAFGAIINLASNVSSYWPSLIPVKIGGILMGATIPLGTAIAIWIFATTLISGDKQTATTTTRQTNDKTATANASEDLDRQDSDMSDRRLSDKITDKLKTMGIVGKTLVKTVADDKTTDRQDIDDGQTNDTTTDDKTADNDKTTTAKQTIGQQGNQTDRDDKLDSMTDDSQDDLDTKTSQTAAKDKDRQAGTKTIDKTTETADDNQDRKTNRQTKLSLIKGSKTDTDRDDKDKIVRQKAIDYYNQTGKFPSYRQLGEMAGVSKDKAGKIIRQLKTKIS